jgi:hypothetical protein
MLYQTELPRPYHAHQSQAVMCPYGGPLADQPYLSQRLLPYNVASTAKASIPAAAPASTAAVAPPHAAPTGT